MFDRDLISFLPASLVQSELDARGAQFTKVTFAKKDGTVTTRTGMPKVFTRRVGGEKGPAATPESLQRAATARKALVDNGNRFFDYAQPDADGKKGFAFNMGRVLAIGTVGTHPE